ncbi:MAG: DUF58 domain-containing protein [Proteobacteria bacterium]|nr:DUF58 domain-containing protein [Pseudomonadota bacterium]
MIDENLVKKLHYIEIKSRKLVNEMFAGEYLSAFRGQGIEFDQVREYYPGDDVRSIDWNVSARFNKLFVKEFQEERELSLYLLVDISNSQNFGTGDKTKLDLATELSAIFAFSAIKHNDKVGLLLFSDKIEKLIPLGKGRRHVMSILNTILTYKPQSKGTSIKNALEYIGRLLTKRAIIIVISDFIDSNYSKEVKLLNRKHDVILLHVYDKKEYVPPKVGFVTMEDLETGEQLLVNTNGKNFKNYFIAMMDNLSTVKDKFRKSGVDTVSIDTSMNYIPVLVNFFKERIRRR